MNQRLWFPVSLLLVAVMVLVSCGPTAEPEVVLPEDAEITLCPSPDRHWPRWPSLLSWASGIAFCGR
jgi:hypothetical protein